MWLFPDTAINIDELVTALRRVLAGVVIKHGAALQLMGDFYWNVPTGMDFDMRASPGDVTVGQLTDDIRSVREFLDRPVEEPISIWHELAHLVRVLRGIEELDRQSI